MTSRETLAAIAVSSGYEALLAINPSVLEEISAAVYTCAADGIIIRFNRRAEELWGRAPQIGETDERFCGSFRLHDLEGRPLPHPRTPMAIALRAGEPQRDQEVVIERPERCLRTPRCGSFGIPFVSEDPPSPIVKRAGTWIPRAAHARRQRFRAI
jgi:hypothetical protein